MSTRKSGSNQRAEGRLREKENCFGPSMRSHGLTWMENGANRAKIASFLPGSGSFGRLTRTNLGQKTLFGPQLQW